MEEKLYEALAKVLLQSSQDQWGNIVQSPLSSALQKWGDENKLKIADIILSKLTVEKLADEVEKRVKDAISIGSTDRYLSGYDRENYQKKLNDLILDKVATMLAQKKLKEFEEIKLTN